MEHTFRFKYLCFAETYFDILSVIKELFPGTLSTAVLRRGLVETRKIYTEVRKPTAFQGKSPTQNGTQNFISERYVVFS